MSARVYDESVLAGAIASCLVGDYDSSGASYFCRLEDGYRIIVTVTTPVDYREKEFVVTVESMEN